MGMMRRLVLALVFGVRALACRVDHGRLFVNGSCRRRRCFSERYKLAGDRPLHFRGEEVAPGAGGAAVDVRIRLKGKKPGVK